MLRFAKRHDLSQRFKQSKKLQDYERQHEANFMQGLHKMQGGNDSVFSKVDLYHLPLSINYYRKLNKGEFVHHVSFSNLNSVLHFNTCTGCRLFVSTRRKTLLYSTKLARRKRRKAGKRSTISKVASAEDLFRIMVSSKSSCAFSGARGVWSPFRKGAVGFCTCSLWTIMYLCQKAVPLQLIICKCHWFF